MQNMEFIDLNPPRDHFLEDVLEGLQKQPKQLLPKYFYDQRGSKLFDKICDLDEYYPTRTEISILDDHASDIENQLAPRCVLIEYGSGSSVKIKKLLDETHKITHYIPIDISKEHLKEAADRINQLYPKLSVTAICADYTKLDTLPEIKGLDSSLQRLIFFPGSTIGNLLPQQAFELLKNAHRILGKDGKLILGFDLIKDPQVLKAAYDDREGVTAAFNRNILHRINRELQADFVVDDFVHEARFNQSKERVEMHLVAKRDCQVSIKGHSIAFQKGESIHTESSHKYRLESFANFAKEAGFVLDASFTDDKNYFAICIFRSLA